MIPKLPEPFRKQGQQMSYDGDDCVFCDCWAKEQVLAIQEEAYKAGMAAATKDAAIVFMERVNLEADPSVRLPLKAFLLEIANSASLEVK